MYELLQLELPRERLRFAIVILALAVVSWGLQYKLTLYAQPAEVYDSAPAVKLLSQKERALQDDNSSLLSGKCPALLEMSQSFTLIFMIGKLCPSILEAFPLNESYFGALFEKIRAIRPPPFPSVLT